MTRKRLPAKRKVTRIKSKIGGMRIYVDMGEYPDGTLGEVFVTTAKAGSVMRGMLDSWSRMLSVGLQYGVPLHKVISMDRNFEFDPRGDYVDIDDEKVIRTCSSIMDFVVQVLEKQYPEQAKKKKEEEKA
jgi:hypothetical protein